MIITIMHHNKHNKYNEDSNDNDNTTTNSKINVDNNNSYYLLSLTMLSLPQTRESLGK